MVPTVSRTQISRERSECDELEELHHAFSDQKFAAFAGWRFDLTLYFY